MPPSTEVGVVDQEEVRAVVLGCGAADGLHPRRDDGGATPAADSTASSRSRKAPEYPPVTDLGEINSCCVVGIRRTPG
jgi:hypothetical protein